MKPSLAATVLALGVASVTPLACDGSGGGEERSVKRDLGLIQNDTLIVGSEIPFPPFEGGEPPEYEGFDIDVINAVAEELGLETRIENVPLNLILSGDARNLDVAISAVRITPDREKRVNFSVPYFLGFFSLVVREDSEITSLGDLGDGAIVGVEDGTSAERFATRDTEAAEIRAFASAAEAFTALSNSDINAAIVVGPQAADAVEADESLELAATFPTRKAYGIVLPEGDDALLEAVDVALTQLEEDGTLADLYEEYFGAEAPIGIATP